MKSINNNVAKHTPWCGYRTIADTAPHEKLINVEDIFKFDFIFRQVDSNS